MDEILANQLKDALAVILLDPFLSKVLFRLDPMAFRQAQNALNGVGIDVELPKLEGRSADMVSRRLG